jgi:hypothetical protein
MAEAIAVHRRLHCPHSPGQRHMTNKQLIIDTISKLPDTASKEDTRYEVGIAIRVELAIHEYLTEKAIPNHEVMKDVRQCLSKPNAA